MLKTLARGGRLALVVTLLLGIVALSFAQEAKKEMKPRKPPRGATVLFNGKDLSQWEHRGSGEAVGWQLKEGDAVEVTPGKPDIMTKEKFTDFQLHVEFRTPLMPEAKSQARGNSGVYLHGLYEIQVLDSYQNETYKFGGCGSIYGQKDPDVNMCKPPMEWQSYDITFRAPRFDAAGKLSELARVTVVWNGKKVHNNIEIKASTTSSLGGPPTPNGPILLQNHGCAVQYRNLWIVPKHLK